MRGRLAPAAMYPAAESGIRARLITLPNGLRLRVVETGPAAGEPVLLIHGWGACVYTFRHALDALARAGYRAVSFDSRGHGLSDKPVGRDDYVTPALVADVDALLNALELERVNLVGHSLGGSIAVRFALAHRSRVTRLVLAAPVGLTAVPIRAVGHALTPRFTVRFARYLPPRWVTALLLRAAYGEPSRVTDRVIDEYWAPSQFPGYFIALRRLLARFAWEPIPPRELAGIGTRTLVILGTADRLIRGAEEPAGRIVGASVVSLEGAGHLGIEECASEFNERLIRFLAE